MDRRSGGISLVRNPFNLFLHLSRKLVTFGRRALIVPLAAKVRVVFFQGKLDGDGVPLWIDVSVPPPAFPRELDQNQRTRSPREGFSHLVVGKLAELLQCG